MFSPSVLFPIATVIELTTETLLRKRRRKMLTNTNDKSAGHPNIHREKNTPKKPKKHTKKRTTKRSVKKYASAYYSFKFIKNILKNAESIFKLFFLTLIL